MTYFPKKYQKVFFFTEVLISDIFRKHSDPESNEMQALKGQSGVVKD